MIDSYYGCFPRSITLANDWTGVSGGLDLATASYYGTPTNIFGPYYSLDYGSFLANEACIDYCYTMMYLYSATYS